MAPITIQPIAGDPPRYILTDDHNAFPESGLSIADLQALHAAIGAHLNGDTPADDLLTVEDAVELSKQLGKGVSATGLRWAVGAGKITGVKHSPIRTGRGKVILIPRSNFLAWLNSDRRYRGGSRRKAQQVEP